LDVLIIVVIYELMLDDRIIDQERQKHEHQSNENGRPGVKECVGVIRPVHALKLVNR